MFSFHRYLRSLPLYIIAGVLLLLAGISWKTGAIGHRGEDLGSAPQSIQPVENSPTSGVQFYESFENGKKIAQEKNRPMLVFFTAEWCSFCHQMTDETFSQQRIIQLSERFVCVMVDADKEPGICDQYKIRGYPTVLFLSPEGIPLDRLTGFAPPNLLESQMQGVIKAVVNRPPLRIQR